MPDQPKNLIESFFSTMYNVLNGPVEFVREKIVVPNQQHYPWYHQKFQRVPTIDQCYDGDVICMFEADMQYKRDKMVENEILNILRQRFEDCVLYEEPDHEAKCRPLLDMYNDATTNWFIKYGDLGAKHSSKVALMKQKHRMIWERRHGPVGSAAKEVE